VGQFVISEGVATYGTIASNSANTIELASFQDAIGDYTSAGVYKPSCELNFGDPSAVVPYAVTLSQPSPIVFNGIKVRGPTGSAVRLRGHPSVQFQLCDLEGVLVTGPGQAAVFDACHLSGVFSQDGRATTIRASYLHDMDYRSHGEGGQGVTYHAALILDAVGIYGGGNSHSAHGFGLNNSLVRNAPGAGVTKIGPMRASLIAVRINDSVGNAVTATGNGGYLQMYNVAGTGNGGYGLQAQNGAHVQVQAGTDVTGASGDVQVGALGAVNDWADLPKTDYSLGDTSEGVRVYV